MRKSLIKNCNIKLRLDYLNTKREYKHLTIPIT